uniref:Alanine--glyoxylate aminotransferase 2-like n=1 Tax=Globodera pallida TaxID=36090 RepID=A0A183C8Q1_GLOPA
MDSLTQFVGSFSPFGGTFTKSPTKSKKEEQFKQQNFRRGESEANDLALQLARDWTGAEDVIVLENAYHGHLTTTVQMSPYKFDRGSSIKQPEWVHVGPAPDLYRGKYRHADEDFGDEKKRSELNRKYVDDIRRILERATAEGRRVAAFIAEAMQSCGGQVVPPRGYFRQVAEVVRAHGGVVIVDEVQTGFGRVGDTFWAHQLDGEDGEFVPDIVTIGKSMGNGYPIAAVVTRKEIADKHCGAVNYFNTYGGNPASCAAALSVLRVIREENLLEHCRKMGELFRKELNGLKERHKSVGDVRGAGMFWGVDLVKSRCTREPNSELAHKLILKLKREDGVLLSTDGPYGNILKFKPPLCFGVADLRESVNALDKALGELSNEEEMRNDV